MPGKRLDSQAQAMVLHLLRYFEAEKQNGGPLIPVSAVHERAAAALGISERTISNIKHRNKENERPSTPGKLRPRKKEKSVDLPEPVKVEIRNSIYDMYLQKKHVTLNTLREHLRVKEIVQISRSSLHRTLHEIGFKFKKDSNRRALIEKTSIAAMRSYFIREYRKNLQAPDSLSRTVVFVDETWIYSKGAVKRSWQNESIKSVRKPEGYDGKRYIIVHAGSTNGFIQNANLIFASKSQTGDYHGEMNSECFKKWVEEKLIKNLEEPSLIIMDNAPYHSQLKVKQPSSTWRKTEIIKWLQENEIPFENDMKCKELLQLAKRNRRGNIYIIDELLREHGHEVLRLPPYHCDFNAIELVWAKAKTYYNSHIGRDGYKEEDVLNMWQEALDQVTPEIWANCVRHTNEVIEKWRLRDAILDDINPVIITGEETSDSELSNTDDES